MDAFCVRIFTLNGTRDPPKAGIYIFKYLELVYFDGYLMPYFDDYLAKVEPELLESSNKIMKLALYYDYSTRLGKECTNTCTLAKDISVRINKISKKVKKKLTENIDLEDSDDETQTKSDYESVSEIDYEELNQSQEEFDFLDTTEYIDIDEIQNSNLENKNRSLNRGNEEST